MWCRGCDTTVTVQSAARPARNPSTTHLPTPLPPPSPTNFLIEFQFLTPIHHSLMDGGQELERPICAGEVARIASAGGGEGGVFRAPRGQTSAPTDRLVHDEMCNTTLPE